MRKRGRAPGLPRVSADALRSRGLFPEPGGALWSVRGGLDHRGVRLSFGGARRSGPKQAGQGGERHVDHGRPLGPLRWPAR